MLYENGAHLRSTPPENHLGEKDNRAKCPALTCFNCRLRRTAVWGLSVVPLINPSYPELYSRQQPENKSMLLSNPIAFNTSRFA